MLSPCSGTPSCRSISRGAPYFHGGCAPTLSDLAACGGDPHGVPGLGDDDRADLAAYLGTL